jgi:hypothetical protein
VQIAQVLRAPSGRGWVAGLAFKEDGWTSREILASSNFGPRTPLLLISPTRRRKVGVLDNVIESGRVVLCKLKVETQQFVVYCAGCGGERVLSGGTAIRSCTPCCHLTFTVTTRRACTRR